MENRYKISYDMKTRSVFNIKFKQGDIDSSVLEVSLLDGGLPVNITGEVIEFRFLKSDKTIVYQDSTSGVSIIDALTGKIQCILKSNTLAASGIVICEIHRSLSGKGLTTPSFCFTVESSVGENGIKSTNYISLVENKIIEWQTEFETIKTDYNTYKNVMIAESNVANLQSQINSVVTSQAEKTNQLKNHEVKFTAHRGLNNAYPENTLLAFEMACLAGFKVLECDIQPTSDNVLVIHHDLTVDRMTNGTGNVTSFTLTQIQALTIDGGFGASEYPNTKVPTLEEFLILCRKYNVKPMIEFKVINNYSQLNTVIGLLLKYGFEYKSSIISPVTYLIDEFRKRGGKSECLLLDVITSDNTNLLKSYGNCGYASDYSVVTQLVIENLHNDGLTIAVYTVNDTTIARQLKAWGADYITTDAIKEVS